MNQEVFSAVAAALERGGSGPRDHRVGAGIDAPVGAKMVVFADGRTVGTIGGGCYENDAFWKAREVLTTHKPQVVRYELTDDFAEETGLIWWARWRSTSSRSSPLHGCM